MGPSSRVRHHFGLSLIQQGTFVVRRAHTDSHHVPDFSPRCVLMSDFCKRYSFPRSPCLLKNSVLLVWGQRDKTLGKFTLILYL